MHEAIGGEDEPHDTGGYTSLIFPTRVIIASLMGIPRYLTFHIRGTIQGQCVYMAIDIRATHNFINMQMV